MGSTSKTDLWSRALDRIGETIPIEDETDTSVSASVCRRHYDDCLRECLESYPWQWAVRQAAIAQLSGVTRNGWEYCYSLPSDCVTPLAILWEDQRRTLTTSNGRNVYDLLRNDAGDGVILCCDLDTDDLATLEYVALVENVVSMPAQFVDALVWRLAAELALALRKDRALAAGCMQAFAESIARAGSNAMRARQEDPEPDPPSITVRY